MSLKFTWFLILLCEQWLCFPHPRVCAIDDVTPLPRCRSVTPSVSHLYDGVRSAACPLVEYGSTEWWSIRSSVPLKSRCTTSTSVEWLLCRAPTSSSSSMGISDIEAVNRWKSYHSAGQCVCVFYWTLFISFHQVMLLGSSCTSCSVITCWNQTQLCECDSWPNILFTFIEFCTTSMLKPKCQLYPSSIRL